MRHNINMKFSIQFTGWLGRGGFAEVHRGVHVESGEEIAVKMLRDYTNPDSVSRFAREINLMVQYPHPGIVPVRYYDLSNQKPFYVTPYMSGGVLTQHAGQLQYDYVRYVASTVADVLQHVHSIGGYNRDIKPDNLLLDGRGRVFISDFGVGNDPRITRHFTQNALGTPGYWAPELQRGAPAASPACDMFSLGASLFHLITGVHPSEANSLDPKEHRPQVPDDLRGWVVALTQHDPTKRPTAVTLLHWIQTKVSPRVVAAPPPPPPAQPPQEVEGSFGQFLFGALAFVGAVAGLAYIANAGGAVGGNGGAVGGNGGAVGENGGAVGGNGGA
jgi:serine/threonine protein kinase